MHTHEFATLPASDDLIGELLIALLVSLECLLPLKLLSEEGMQQGQSEDYRDGVTAIGVEGAYGYVLDRRPDAEGSVGGKSPGGCRPSEEVGSPVTLHLFLGIQDGELCDTGRILHVPIASRLVQFVGTESGTSCGGVGLYGVAFVE